MNRQRGETVSKHEANKFIQKTAESTGLIAIGYNENENDEDAIVTFMHHSFMEYFAAVGLSRDIETLDVVSLITQPRWIEILTLLAGIIGESKDIAPVLTKFIKDGTQFGEVDAKLLLFAIDCALECDIPSEAAIRLLASSICKCIENGPAKCDPWIRSEIGHRLSQLISSCGFSSFESTIAMLIRNNDTDICAAGLSLSGYACTGDVESTVILKAVEESCSRIDEDTQCAICEVAGKVKWFQNYSTLQVIARCLKKSNRCKKAALEAILKIPGLAAKHWPEIINSLDESLPSVRRLASQAAIQAGLDSDLAAMNDSKRDVVANALQCIYESSFEQEYPGSKIREETVSRFLNSCYLKDRLIGIQMIPAVESSDDYAYRKLMEVIDNTDDHQEITAALKAMRYSPNARILFTISDIKKIAKFFESGRSDVRKASIQLLGLFGADISAIRALLDQDFDNVIESEYSLIFLSLSRALVLQDDVASLIEKEIRDHVGIKKKNKSYEIKMCALLNAGKDLGKNLQSEIAGSIKGLIGDYRENDDVRKAALCAYPAIAMPTSQVVDFLTQLFQAPPANMILELVQTPGILAKNCRQNVVYIIACVEAMSRLRESAILLHKKLLNTNKLIDKEYIITELRDGIQQVYQIILTFEEFINPVQK